MYKTYLSSQVGKLAAFEGKKPTLEKDNVAHFGIAQRVGFLQKAIVEEEKKRKLGFWKALLLMPKALERTKEIRNEVESVRLSKEMEDKASRLLGDQYLENSLEAADDNDKK